MSWSKDEVVSFINEQTRIGRLATVAADGTPHVVPIWFKTDGNRLLVHTQAESRKARNIAATGKYSITIDQEALPYKGVTVGGSAQIVGDEIVDSRALAKDLAVAYMGPEQGPGFGEYVANMPGQHITLVLDIDEHEAWDFAG